MVNRLTQSQGRKRVEEAKAVFKFRDPGVFESIARQSTPRERKISLDGASCPDPQNDL